MKKHLIHFLALAVCVLTGVSARAIGWPAGHEGVMLQAFYWDSYNDTRWQALENQSDELSEYFNLIWVPNSAYAGGGRNMGYMPINWFTNHNSSFGGEAQLRRMINTFKAKGTGIIADVVVNHRNGRSNWTDFPEEQWNGRTWKLGPEHICSNDEVRNASGQATPTGAPDTGDNFDGARDLDHTNATVQDNVKNYCKCLLEDFGYAGFRLDMVKGYAGRYTRIYNQYSKPKYCVGEYFDASYDAVAAWIEATGRESAAFDFPCKYAINSAFSSNDMTKLVWYANGSTPQPAGLIHYGYPQLAVTFVDNHDTYRDGSRFNGNVLAANAFILCSPGTPCVFLPHWKAYKEQIKTLIAIRNAVGVSNTSAVTVLKTTGNCYLARVTGSKGTLAVRIGSSSDVPEGFSSADIKASGNGYCVWTKTEIIGGGGDTVEMPSSLYVLGDLSTGAWKTDNGVRMTKDGNTFVAENVAFTTAPSETKCYFNLTSALAATWDELNATADRFGAASEGDAATVGTAVAMTKYACGVNASGCQSWTVAPGTYRIVADFEKMTLTVSKPAGIEAIETIDAPAEYYNLQGVRVENPGTGLYIVRRGNTVTKEYIR